MLRSLQAGRALATILVVLFHANHSIFALPKYFGSSPLGHLFDFGPAAIDFFFVLSGFVILYVHYDDLGQPHALIDFLWRRYSRLYIFYWVVLAAIVPVYFLFPQFGHGDERSPDTIVRSILLLPHPQQRMIVVASWTMVYDVLFYALFGLLILNRRLGIAVFAAWTIAILLLHSGDDYVVNFILDARNLRFIAGMLACVAVKHWQIPLPRLVFGIGVAIFAITATLHVVGAPISSAILGHCYTISSAVAIVGMVELERSGKLPIPSLLTGIGDAAFAIYLTHFPALSLLAKITKVLQLDAVVPALVLFAAHVAAAIALGWIAHLLLERPIHLWTKRLFRKRPAPGAETPTPQPELGPALSKAA